MESCIVALVCARDGFVTGCDGLCDGFTRFVSMIVTG
jgi:hypothetical protein